MKIAKIVAYTIVASSIILGTFILASAYLQARASCDQVQALDSVLEKELVLETLQQVNRVSLLLINYYFFFYFLMEVHNLALLGLF